METPDDLAAYVARPGAVYGWELVGEERRESTTLYDVHLTSQSWQGIEWQHHLLVAVPNTIRSYDTACLAIQADYVFSEWTRRTAAVLADATGLVCASLFNVPNQPLFDGLVEDALIVQTFVEYLDGNGDDWPLLYPMVKSAVRAMDAVQGLRAQQEGEPPSRFIVGGASKRGWTSWLTAVVDPRVAGIIPQVYDNLNLFAQMPHQVEVWNQYSEQIHDYTDVDLPSKMQTPRGFQLARIIDPYTYRQRLSMPKLIINAANDRYWATDALNFYWDDLEGPKNVLYVPNSGHGIQDYERLVTASASFIRAVSDGRTLPQLDSEIDAGLSSISFRLTADTAMAEARVWAAYSESQDFRDCDWVATRLDATRADNLGFAGVVARPENGFLAIFGEGIFEHEDIQFPLSTPLRIIGGTGPE